MRQRRSSQPSRKIDYYSSEALAQLFAIGLLYDRDHKPAEESEEYKTITESLKTFSMTDVCIMIYTMLIVLPVPILLVNLFERKELNPIDPIEKIEKAKKYMKIKLLILVVICFWVFAW